MSQWSISKHYFFLSLHYKAHKFLFRQDWTANFSNLNPFHPKGRIKTHQQKFIGVRERNSHSFGLPLNITEKENPTIKKTFNTGKTFSLRIHNSIPPLPSNNTDISTLSTLISLDGHPSKNKIVLLTSNSLAFSLNIEYFYNHNSQIQQ